jgi:subtilisin family serine protease
VGNAVFLAAPGTADFPVGYQGQPGPYAGTSIAAATVSHALGLYFQRNPQATAEQATRALQSAVSQSGAARNAQVGHGVLDADALQRLLR